MNYQSNYMYKPSYPVQNLPSEMQDFIQCIVASTKTPVELVAPVVLSAAAAAVQGVVDVKPPFGGSMPTSLFFGVVMGSGYRKSSVRDLAFLAFEEFEQGRLAVDEQGGADSRSVEPQSHTFLIEKSTKQGIIDLFRQGAKSVCYAPDEGGMYLDNLDLAFACKRFDGGTIREITQTNPLCPDRAPQGRPTRHGGASSSSEQSDHYLHASKKGIHRSQCQSVSKRPSLGFELSVF